ncbi:DNA-binding domain-containing protein [Neotabrizicola sp. VNH66]|uniref:HvfC/BufC N-terminal domain-containing protein n=1 Tax=Neotabrizicola sp. VNH66 TaxID=3400918 RepID=UPI003C011DB7
MPPPAEHPAFLQGFARALAGGALPQGLTAPGDEAARRFAVYRNNVAVARAEALAARFPVIRQLTGAEFFAALARVFIAAHPPQGPVLQEWGAAFPGFVKDFPPLAGHPYMADVARIEWARGEAFNAADATPLPPAALTGADPAALHLRLHPSLRLLYLDHPAVSLWAAHQPGAQPAALPQGPEVALVLRDAGFAVPVWRLCPGDAALMAALMRDETLATAAEAAQMAEAGHDPAPFLVRLMRAGAFVTGATP